MTDGRHVPGEGFFRLLLRLHPRAFREQYGEEMTAFFRDAWRDQAQGRGMVPSLAFWLRTVLGTGGAALRQRLRGGGRGGGHGTGLPGGPNSMGSGASVVSWLDFKLGFRMLLRYPGLTLVGGLAMAFAIWLGTATFEFVNQMVSPSLPLPAGERIVGVRNFNVATGRVDPRALHDFLQWRSELRSVEELGAFRDVERNLITEDGGVQPAPMAEISASAFRITGTPPLLGRTLVESDERAGAPPVVVIGYRLWRNRFGGSPDAVGQSVKLGADPATVVGVMPEGFAFPVSHDLWVPLRLEELVAQAPGPRQGPGITVFGRLAPGTSLDEAQVELTALGARMAAEFPETHQRLRPQVMPYAAVIMNLSPRDLASLFSINLSLLVLLMLVCANVALLMFARAATREAEIAVRSALGAGRRRIVMQLFIEALVLGGVAAAVGLGAASLGLRWGLGILEAERGRLPFWVDAKVSPEAVLYALGLTVLAALVSGVLPALKVTRGDVRGRLREHEAGSGLKFGGIWTAVIVTQVALTVAFPVFAFGMQRSAAMIRDLDVGFPAEEYLSVRLEMDREASAAGDAGESHAAFLERFRNASEELGRRVEAEPGAKGVTFASHLPWMYHPWGRIEMDEGGAEPEETGLGHRIGTASVAPDYFAVVGADILAGRGFHGSDLEGNAGVVIVNQSFVEQVLGGRNPIGRRVRYVDGDYLEDRPADAPPEPWHEIVGVVPDLGMTSGVNPEEGAGIYHPLGAAVDEVAIHPVHPVHMAIHVGGASEGVGPRLRPLASAVDPRLRLYDIQPLDEVSKTAVQTATFWFSLILLLSGVTLVLSLTGIYAVMSFTVARRTREIGIRVALGAEAPRVVLAIFRRPLLQVGIGLVAGWALIIVFMTPIMGSISPRNLLLLSGYGLLVGGVCMLACVVPTRRALRVEPSEALRQD